jgi:Flp pilus assembly protein TadG
MKPSGHHKARDNEKGATIVLVAILLVVIMGIAALAIDIGNLASTKGELQKLADGASLAAAGELGKHYLTGTCDTISLAAISGRANYVAEQNVAAAKSITLQSSDVVLGCWVEDHVFRAFGEGDCNCSSNPLPNAVKVTAHRDSEANTPVDTFFAGILGPDAVGLRADAVAALSGPGEALGVPIPVGISKAWFDEANWASEDKGFCDQDIKFYPTGDLTGCAGWNVFGSWPSNAAKLAELLECLALPESDPDYCPPPTLTAGDNLVYTGGTVATAFDAMKNLFDTLKVVDPDYPDFPDGVWKVTVPVYDRDDCSNPQNEIRTVGFTTAVITEVLETPEKTINAVVICDEIIPSHGGGGPFGTLSSIPGLVE